MEKEDPKSVEPVQPSAEGPEVPPVEPEVTSTPAVEAEPAIAKVKVPKKICPNCEKKLGRKDDYCPHCGQKQTATKVKMSDVLWKLWTTTFHLDNKFLRTMRYLFVPGKLTIEYFSGRQKRYYHPVQFYFVTLFFLVLVISFRNRNREVAPQLINLFPTANQQFFNGQVGLRDSLRMALDTSRRLSLSPAANRQLATLIDAAMNDRVFNLLEDTLDLQFWKGNYLFAFPEVMRLPVDSLLKKQKVEHPLDRWLAKQALRGAVQPEKLNSFWVGSVSWVLLVLVGVMAGWLKLLYWRHNRYFVEHFVFLLHLQTGLLMAVLITVLLRTLIPATPKNLAAIIVLWPTLGYWLGLKRYYGQSFWRTTWKFIGFQFLYLISLILVAATSVGLAILFF